ncbi:hypothetical protein BDN72DRAFT_769259 [Pluteus cervinus]|uniref:Uncharacterized protein n=1 Tax=Pluteus cervinus TaxID=181527 RepID=A0ACD3AR93_9AGAR|nr:hypothetical protein BDN72DRAFT_769259 [Pluteus cervinus]
MATSPPDGIGLSDRQNSRRQRILLDQINKLHSTGVHVDIDLPQISVVGSQSAGKSSLIEAISGITLPRAAGTCTRCPTECRLTYSNEPWSCKVSLQFIWDASDQSFGQARNEPFGDPITEKSHVEERIRRAQRAILNPSTASHLFLTANDDTPNERSFSKNRILLQISGPDVADLSFCDLPGLIASVSTGGNSEDIDLVKDLVQSYIEKPSCVILLTVACETDFENQGAHHLTKEHDPDGERTVGVLTKPDRIPTGEENGWLRFIMNVQEPLEHNWFCVKQPSSQELREGITWAGAREREDQFFTMTRPWRQLDPIYKRYLGTPNLVERLSSILSDLIEKRLPEIQEEIDSAIRHSEEELARLPKEPPQDPLREVMGLLHHFVADLQGEIGGRPNLGGLIQTIRPHQDDFRQIIRRTAPVFLPFARSDSTTRGMSPFSFLHDEEEDNEASDEERDDSASDHPDVICIDEVMNHALGARSRELPGHIPFAVQRFYIDKFVAHWPEPAAKLCHAVNSILNELVGNLVREHFATFGQGGLERPVRMLLQDHLKACSERGTKQIEWLLNLEKPPFTSNSYNFASYQKQFLSHYRATRYWRPPPSGPVYNGDAARSRAVAQVLAGLSQLGISVDEEDLRKLRPADQMDPALGIMADVRAYFQVAHQRFVDNIPMAIDFELVQGLGRDIFEILSTGLGLNGPNAQECCREWAREPPAVAARRAELKKKLERLQGARLELMQINL